MRSWTLRFQCLWRWLRGQKVQHSLLLIIDKFWKSLKCCWPSIYERCISLTSKMQWKIEFFLGSDLLLASCILPSTLFRLVETEHMLLHSRELDSAFLTRCWKPQQNDLSSQLAMVLAQNTCSMHTSLANYFLTLVVFREYAADNKSVAKSGSGTRPVTC